MMTRDDFSNLRKLKGEFKTARVSIIGLLLINLILTGLLILSYMKQEKLPDRLMLLDTKGNVFNAQLQDLSVNDIKAEAKNHISAFLTLVYANDQFSYKENTNRCKNLAKNEVVQSLLGEQDELEVYDKMVKFNLRTTVEINLDSIEINNNLEGIAVFKQNVIRDEKIRTSYIRKIHFLIERKGLKRTETNPHMMLISNYKLLAINQFEGQ